MNQSSLSSAAPGIAVPPRLHAANTRSAGIPIDFPDWINPLIVKELRQGLRGRLFTAAFLLLHGILSYATISFFLAEDSSFSISGIFWPILIFGLLFISASAQGTIRSERTNNTLELIQLTRQSAWRIALGKWGAVTVLSALFLSSFLPYYILSYFLGKFNLLHELTVFIIFLFGAAALNAVMLFLSTFSGKIGVAAGILFVFGFFSGLGGALFKPLFSSSSPLSYGSSGASVFIFTITGVLAALTLYTFLFLLLATGRISTNAENPVVRKRLLGWLMLLAPAIAFFTATEEIASTLCTAAFPAGFLFFDALLTSTSHSLPSFKKFGRFPVIKHLSVLLLSPSRASGIFYVVLTLSVFFLLAFLSPVLDTPPSEMTKGLCFFISCINSLLLPVALAHLLGRRKFKSAFVPRFWVFFIIEAVFPLIVFTLTGANQSFGKILISASPLGMAILSVLEKTDSVEIMLLFALFLFVLCMVSLSRYLKQNLAAALKMCGGNRADFPPE